MRQHRLLSDARRVRGGELCDHKNVANVDVELSEAKKLSTHVNCLMFGYLLDLDRKAADRRHPRLGSTRPSSRPSKVYCTLRVAFRALRRRPFRSQVFGNLLSIDRTDMNTPSDRWWDRWIAVGPYHSISNSVVHWMWPSTVRRCARQAELL